jgi:hypothetical protein
LSTELERIQMLCDVLGARAENMDALRAAHPVTSAAATRIDGDAALWGGNVGAGPAKINGEFYWFDDIEPVYAELDQLIRYAPADLHERVFSNEKIRALAPGIHRVRAAYERDRELIQARNLVQAQDGQARLKRTIEHESYWAFGEELRRALDSSQHILVAGSGPLPLTALCIGAALDVRVTCVERDAECHALGRRLIAMSGRGEHFQCINADILKIEHFDDYDAIVGVVLLGVGTGGKEQSTKATIARHIMTHMPPGARMVLRDPHGLGKLLYPSVDLQAGSDVQITRHVPEVGPTKPYRSGLVIAERRPAG